MTSSYTKPMKDPILFWSRAEVMPDGCWLWVTKTTDEGYGIYHDTLAHRFAYCLEFDDPGDSEVKHQCGNKLCVNPTHLTVAD